MANLCPTCSNKTPSHIGGGGCTGKPNGNACNTITTSISFKLCDNCAQAINQCKWCLANMNGSGTNPGSTPVGIRFITVRDTDNGKTFKNMNVGEQVHIELDEDQWSGKEWDIKSTGVGLNRQMASIFIQDPTNYQYGTRKFIIDIRSSASGQTGVIEVHEVTRRYGGWYGYGYGGTPVPNGKTWSIKVEVK